MFLFFPDFFFFDFLDGFVGFWNWVWFRHR